MPKNNFAALPERAIGDARLTCSHWRVLAAIALHDRLSARRKQGAGCYASNKTLSEKCGINYSNFSTVVRQLGLWGYIVSAPHPISKRTRVYRVIYGDADTDDSLPTGKQSDDETTADTLPTGKASSQNDGGNVEISTLTNDPLPTGEQSAKIVCPPTQQVTENAQQPNDKYIPLNGKIFSETVKDSAEAAPLSSGDGLRAKKSSNDGWYLQTVEQAMKELGYAHLPFGDQKLVTEIAERRYTDDPLHHQAERILETWGQP